MTNLDILEKELEEAKELKLTNQVKILEKELKDRKLRLKINELFKIKETNKKINRIPIIKMIISIVLVLLFGYLIAYTTLTSTKPVNSTNGMIILGYIFCCIGSSYGFALYLAMLNEIKLTIEPVDKTDIYIPRGAKINLKEAKTTGLFKEFYIAKPSIVQKQIDPALLGKTEDNRLFMICYWDIERDLIEVTEQAKDKKNNKIINIDRFKKFKII
jgi:hypothetical protein